MLHVHPAAGRQSDVRGWPAAALVLVVDPASGTDIDSVMAAATLDLTWMENRVAVLLARGMSVGKIAAATGGNESTIRSRVKHVFVKHGLSRLMDLARLVQCMAGAAQPRR